MTNIYLPWYDAPKFTIEIEFDLSRYGGSDLADYLRCRKNSTLERKLQSVLLEFLDESSPELFKAIQKIANRDEPYSDFISLKGTVNGKAIPDYYQRELADKRKQNLKKEKADA